MTGKPVLINGMGKEKKAFKTEKPLRLKPYSSGFLLNPTPRKAATKKPVSSFCL